MLRLMRSLSMDQVNEHQITRRLVETVNDPTHLKRIESKEFRLSKKRLKMDGHYKCYICGITEHLQVHHYGAEWMFAEVIDFDKLKEFCEEWDAYGYGKLLKHTPIKSVDDVRNCLVLCREHHNSGDSDGAANGIHNITFPAWISQKLVRTGFDTVPQDDNPSDGL